jgi:hypothetical protein
MGNPELRGGRAVQLHAKRMKRVKKMKEFILRYRVE